MVKFNPMKVLPSLQHNMKSKDLIAIYGCDAKFIRQTIKNLEKAS